MFKPIPEIYTKILKSTRLTDQDRECLKKKRGFTDETIDTLQFRSAGAYVGEIIKALHTHHSANDLLSSSVIDGLGKPTWQFANEGQILIPYLDTTGQYAEMFKAHKNGSLNDADPAPYCNFVKKPRGMGKDNMIVLCEGEFKAAAMWQMGWRAIGLGGITTFLGKSLAKLKEAIVDAAEIVILFDTEIQDNPDFSNYKDDFRKMFTQVIASFTLGKRLEMLVGEHQNVRIATLPVEWTVDGKTDIDGALAAGHTTHEFEAVIADAVSPDNYKRKVMSSIKEKFRPWVARRLETAYRVDYVTRQPFNYYTVDYVDKKGNSTTIEVSNFVIDIKNMIINDNDIYREVQLKNKLGDSSQIFHLLPEELSNYNNFKKKCLSKGDFVWKGNDKQFTALVERLFLDSTIIPITIIRQVGRVKEHGIWLFDNIAIAENGTPLTLRDGSFWGVENGYKIANISSSSVPTLSTTPIDLKETLRMFDKAWGLQGIIGFAFVIATLFYEEIFEKYKLFPICFIWGEKESGKSTLADIMGCISGFPASESGLNISDTTQVAIGRKLAYFSSIPVRLDEFRTDDKRIESKNSMLRSIYNRQGASKGTRDKFVVREVEVNTSLIIVGEERPTDSALNSRTIPLYLENKNKNYQTYEAMEWLYSNADKLSYITYHFIKKHRDMRKKLIDDIEATRSGLSRVKGVEKSMRFQIHMAIIMGVIGTILDGDEAIEIQKRLVDFTITNSLERQEESLMNMFWNDLMTIKLSGVDLGRFVETGTYLDDDCAIHFGGVYGAWAEFKRGHGKIMSETAVRTYLKSQKYTKADGVKVFFKRQGMRLRAFTFDTNHPDAPDSMKDFFKMFEGATDKLSGAPESENGLFNSINNQSNTNT